MMSNKKTIPIEESTSEEFNVNKINESDKVIAIASNPNVGKSTVFNALTGMNQHTGNWPGKTVGNAQGRYTHNNRENILVDIPGTYSLMAHSAEEEIARDFICFGNPDAVIVVCDATCLERNINLVLQTLEITKNVVVCVNLIDEAKKKKIRIDFEQLEKNLGVPVIPASARSNIGLDKLTDKVDEVLNGYITNPVNITYIDEIEDAISLVLPTVKEILPQNYNARWVSLRLIDNDEKLIKSMQEYLDFDIMANDEINKAVLNARAQLEQKGYNKDNLSDIIVSCIYNKAENICFNAVHYDNEKYIERQLKIDRILTGKWTGIPIMLLLLAFIFWITISAANYPSQLLSDGLFWIQDRLTDFFHYINAPEWLHGVLVLGIYRVLAWVVSVMLPPMAIFFPLFTLLEDLGYLPRIAFNLDKQFKKCCACGKQALTMCMGFGCNAVGITGCRIIDSPRERLIAIITNNFVPCNGRFPTLIAIITMFFVGVSGAFSQSVLSTIILTAVIVLGVLMTFLISRLLSKTILKGIPSSFTLELPPYRRPQIGKVIVRSVLDRTLFVLGRAVCIAAPAGLIIWVMANVTIGDMTLLAHCSNFLDPFANLFGLDGVILMAFILGFPANEIVIPIIIMTYMASGTITDFDNLLQLKDLLINNGWTWLTAVCTMLFSLMHWPCSTSLITIKKETGSWKWTAISFLVPTITGLLICFIVANTVRLFGLI